jgi:DisA bacterial checkpoint controller nucleotide-binding
MKQRLQSYLGYSYPAHLAELVRKVWPQDVLGCLPGEAHLRLILDVAYHASLLREEQRAVTFRVACIPPQELPGEGPPTGFAPVLLDRPRNFNEQELRRLATAAEFFRSLIGITPDPDDRLNIWGIIVSGTRWVNAVDGGRYPGVALPPSLVVHALGPGRLTIFLGQRRVAALSGGEMEAHAFDLFQAKWFIQSFAAARVQVLDKVYGTIEEKAVPLGGDFLKVMSQNVLRRTLSVVRNSKHGGTLVFIESDQENNYIQAPGLIRFKYRLAEGDTRAHYLKTLARALHRLFQVAKENQFASVGWREYQSVADGELGTLDEALFEFAHFLADLMSVDGALVLTKRFELVGFGAELHADAPALSGVRKALDLEATIWANDPLDDEGTRHRAVYRFCDECEDCIAIVISQDGSVRFVKKHNGAVTYWNQLFW